MALIEKLEAIGDAIRSKTGGNELLTLDDMVDEIEGISGGGGGIDISTTALNYLFYKGRLLDQMPSTEIEVTNNNKDPNYCFYLINNPGKNIPGFVYKNGVYTIEINNNTVSHVFSGLDWLNIPKFDITTYNTNVYSVGQGFKLPQALWGMEKKDGRIWDELPMHVVDFFNTFYQKIWNRSPNWYSTDSYSSTACFSVYIKNIDNFLNNFKPRNWYYISSYSNWPFYAHFLLGYSFINYRFCKDITNLCVVDRNGNEITNNMFQTNSSAAAYTILGYIASGNTLKDFTFELLNGEPYPVKWKNQIIKIGTPSVTSASQNSSGMGSLQNTNSGINLPVVSNATDYEQYKNQHYQTSVIGYARYNHASAVRTLASLPDTTYGGEYTSSGNEIRFYGSQYQGALTDEGPISDLTAEEIAVATNKGWTVSLN